jgi:hypothetical protein
MSAYGYSPKRVTALISAASNRPKKAHRVSQALVDACPRQHWEHLKFAPVNI